MKPEILTASDQVLSAVINGSCQGIVLATIVALGLRWLGRSNAATRHAVWFATLILLAALIPAHFWRHRLVPEPRPLSSAAQDLRPVFESAPLLTAGAGGPMAVSSEPLPKQGGEFEELMDAENTTDPANEPAQGSSSDAEVTADGRALDGTPSESVASREPPASAASPALAGLGTPMIEGHRALAGPFSRGGWTIRMPSSSLRLSAMILLGLWLVVAAIRLALLGWHLYQLRKLKRGSSPPAGELESLFQEIRGEMGIGRNVALRMSSSPHAPAVLGFFHPVILVPLGDAETEPEAAAQILRHELAHVRRYDDWANLVQQFIHAGLFFHPAVWWVSKKLSLEREIACDDCVLERGGGSRPYALLLANLASRMKGRHSVFAPGASNSNSHLQQRINMILDTHRNTSPRLAKAKLGFLTCSAAVLAVLALYSGPRVALAQSESRPAADLVSDEKPASADLSADRRTTPLDADVESEEEDSGDKSAASADSDVAPNRSSNVNAEETPELASSDSLAPTALAPANVSPDAKPKPEAAPEADPAAPAALPSVPAPPVPVAAVAPVAPVAPAAGFQPPTPPEPPGKHGRDSSLEARIERLERTVNELRAERKGKVHAGVMVAKGPDHPGGDGWIDPAAMERVNQIAKQAAEQAEEQAKRAVDQAKRAVEQAERDMKAGEGAFISEKNGHKVKMQQDALGQKIEALQHQRDVLQRQMDELERQMDRLEESQDKLREEQERRSERSENRSQ